MAKNNDQIGIWCSLFANSDDLVSADHFAPVARLSPFLGAGWLVPVVDTETVPCEVCDEPHRADVDLIDEHLKGICRRTGEVFAISSSTSLYRVDGDAFSVSLARALDLDGNTRRVPGLEAVWTLGWRQLHEIRVAFFCTPTLGPIDLATTILSSVADQSRSTASCLLVADEIGAVRLLRRSSVVVRLQDVATIGTAGVISIDGDQLFAAILPGVEKPRSRGRPPEQRKRILQLLEESDNSGPIDTSNASLRGWSLKYKSRFKAKSPSHTTIREAINIWNAQRGFTSSR